MTFSVIGTLCSIVGAILIIVGIVLYTGTGGDYLPFTDYAIAVDVNSKESKVTLYKWNENKRVVEIDNCKTSNGIELFGHENSGAFNHLLYCVQEMASQVHSDHKTPVLLDASEAMTLLEAKNKTEAQSILKHIEESLQSLRANNTNLTFGKPRVINGRQEALDAWVATNYLIQSANATEKQNISSKPENTVSILDMGDVSARIAFEQLSDKSNSEANILGKNYFVQSSSNLCYGLHQALNRFYSLLIKDVAPHSIPPPAKHEESHEKEVAKPPYKPEAQKLPSKVPEEHHEEKEPKEENHKNTEEHPPEHHEDKQEPKKHESEKKPEDKSRPEHHEPKTEHPEEAETLPPHPKLTPQEQKLKNIIENMNQSSPEAPKRTKRESGEGPDVKVEQITVQNPCANKGFESMINGSDLLNEICVNNADGKPPTEHISANMVYKFVGNNDPAKCKEYITKLTSHKECRENFEICALNNITVPEGADFVAFSNYYKLTRAIPELRERSSIPLKKYDDAVKTFCSYPSSYIVKHHSDVCKASEEECKNYCFGLQFIERTLNDLYNFGVEDWINVHFINKINGTHLNWELGDVLLASNKIAGAQATSPILPLYGFVLMLVVGIVLLGYGLTNLYTTQKKRSSYESV